MTDRVVVAESGEDIIGTKCHSRNLGTGGREGGVGRRRVAESGEDIIGTKCHLMDLVPVRGRHDLLVIRIHTATYMY